MDIRSRHSMIDVDGCDGLPIPGIVWLVLFRRFSFLLGSTDGSSAFDSHFLASHGANERKRTKTNEPMIRSSSSSPPSLQIYRPPFSFFALGNRIETTESFFIFFIRPLMLTMVNSSFRSTSRPSMVLSGFLAALPFFFLGSSCWTMTSKPLKASNWGVPGTSSSDTPGVVTSIEWTSAMASPIPSSSRIRLMVRASRLMENSSSTSGSSSVSPPSFDSSTESPNGSSSSPSPSPSSATSPSSPPGAATTFDSDTSPWTVTTMLPAFHSMSSRFLFLPSSSFSSSSKTIPHWRAASKMAFSPNSR
mmetsp:Transcript_20630/g.43123  ORF Transcript_20630/g.43123 Transcript_20630/m.43123 type:complete len:305 (+) Transcript_20630:142-1056(+)